MAADRTHSDLPQNILKPHIRELADLVHVRRKVSGEPYILLLGSSLSLTPEVRRAVCGSDDWEAFWAAMQRRSATERRALMVGPLARLNLAPSYQCLAELARAGYFNVILTANIDDALDDALRILPVSNYKILCHQDQASAYEITSMLYRPVPQVKVVKLRGDINAYKLPLTLEGQFEFPAILKEAIERLLSQDTVLVGDILYDTDIQRCIGKGDGALWVVVPEKPRPGSFLYNVKQARPRGEIITGSEAEFGSFFQVMAHNLLREREVQPSPETDRSKGEEVKAAIGERPKHELPEPTKAKDAEAVAELAKIKANLDQNAQEDAKRSLWLYLGMLAAIWLGLGILTWRFGWSKMEPWTFFIGGGATLGSYAYFAITQNELSPGAIYDRIVELKKRQMYQAFGFDWEKYERPMK